MGTDSHEKVLCDRKMCTKWKTISLLLGFSSSRRSAAIVQTSYGKLRFYTLKAKPDCMLQWLMQ